MLLLLLFAACANAALSVCGGATFPGLGALSQCDPLTDCSWCDRNHLSLDFLCCEPGNWLPPHFLLPLVVQLFWGNGSWVLLYAILVEFIEVIVTILIITGPYVPDERMVETLAGAVLGDIIMQAGLGILAGFVILALFEREPLHHALRRSKPVCGISRTALLFALFAVSGALPLFYGNVRGGLIAMTITYLALIGATWYSTAPVTTRSLTSVYVAWAVIAILSFITHIFNDDIQPLFTPNEWYQQWIMIGPVITIALVVAIVLRYKEAYSTLRWKLVAGIFYILTLLTFVLVVIYEWPGEIPLFCIILVSLFGLTLVVALVAAFFGDPAPAPMLDSVQLDSAPLLPYVPATSPATSSVRRRAPVAPTAPTTAEWHF